MATTLDFLLEINKLKDVMRLTRVGSGRHESTAEHTWSAALIFMVLKEKLLAEFPDLDVSKTYEMILTHDLVEIYAGDVSFFDTEARLAKVAAEQLAIAQLAALEPLVGAHTKALWEEFEAHTSVESQIAQACDKICPVILTLFTNFSLKEVGITRETHDQKKLPYMEFSETFKELFAEVASAMQAAGLFA